jgi:hypothetical protein
VGLAIAAGSAAYGATVSWLQIPEAAQIRRLVTDRLGPR